MGPVTDVFESNAGVFPFFLSVGETVGVLAVVVSIVPIAIDKRTAAGIAEVYFEHFEEFSEKRSVSVVAFLYKLIERYRFRVGNFDNIQKFVKRCPNSWFFTSGNITDKIGHAVDIFRGVTVVHITVVHIKPPGFLRYCCRKVAKRKVARVSCLIVAYSMVCRENYKISYNHRHG